MHARNRNGPVAKRPAAAPRIVRATPADVAALVRLEQRCFDHGVAISRRQFRYLLSRPTAEVWVCREHGRVIADAVLLLRRTSRGLLGRLYSLAVEPTQQGRGIGGGLLRTCLNRLRQRAAYAVVLEVRSDNHRAVALYCAARFRAVEWVNGYYADGGSALRMRLDVHTLARANHPALLPSERRQGNQG